MDNIQYVTMEELEAGLEYIRQSPREEGRLAMIVRRPEVGEREVLTVGELSLAEGLVGDSWKNRSSTRTADGSPHPDMQLNVINARLMALAAPDKARWRWAGDQLFVDLDLSEENLPPGTQLAIGTAVIEITAQPHTGCKKFAERFGVETVKFISTPEGKQLRLRGLNAKVVQPGVIRVEDAVKRINPS